MKKIIGRDNYDYMAFFLTAFLAVIIFSLSGRMIGGDYTICVSDFQTQYVPYIRLFISKIFGDGKFYYSFANALGDELSAQ